MKRDNSTDILLEYQQQANSCVSEFFQSIITKYISQPSECGYYISDNAKHCQRSLT